VKRIAIGVVVFAFLAAALGAAGSSEPKMDELEPGLYAEIVTNRGAMVFSLDWKNAPLTVANFAGLAEGLLPSESTETGERFYDGLPIYRVAPKYAVFSGDPTGTGDGGPGYTLPRESNAAVSAADPGTLMMDGTATESSGSRFFVTVEGDDYLDRKYTPFGSLVIGMRTLKRLREGDAIESVEIRPVGDEAEGLTVNPAVFDRLYSDARNAEIAALGRSNPQLADVLVSMGDPRRKTASGIFYTVVSPGEGAPPTAGSRVSLHYVGALVDGTVFDSSRVQGRTFDFTLGQDSVIPGWIEMVIDMRPGEVRQVAIPPSLAYGEQGIGPIAPNSWLLFEMELVGVIEE